MKVINLLPPEQQRQLELERIAYQLRVFLTMAVLSLVVFIGLGIVTQQYLRLAANRTESQIAESKAKLESSDIKQLQQEVNRLNQNIKEINVIRSQQYRWSEVFLELSRIMPAKSQLNSIQADRATGQAVMVGKAEDRDTVIDIWSQLKKSELFYDVNFPLPNLERPTDSNFTYTFFVNLDQIKHESSN